MKRFSCLLYFVLILPVVCFPQDSTVLSTGLWLANQPGFTIGILLIWVVYGAGAIIVTFGFMTGHPAPVLVRGGRTV